MESARELLILALFCLMTRCVSSCPMGFLTEDGRCVDEDECAEQNEPLCGNNSTCFNTNGSYYCLCLPGFKHSYGRVNFTGEDFGECKDVNECFNDLHTCGLGGKCTNLIGSFRCDCNSGYINDVSGKHCTDVNECIDDLHTCGLGGKCTNLIGSFRCDCNSGYINDVRGKHCTEFDCSRFSAGEGSAPSHGALADLLSVMTNSCLTLSDQRAAGQVKVDGEAMLEKLFTATEAILSPGPLNSSDDVTLLLGTVENAIKLIGPQLKENHTTELETPDTETRIVVKRGRTRPTGPIRLTTENATLDTDWTTAAGSHTGFSQAALVTYKNLVTSSDQFFEELTGFDRDGVEPTFNVFSRVVSVVVSNPSTDKLSQNIRITLRHLQDMKNSSIEYICAYWSKKGTWSTDGCKQMDSNASHTICSSEHLSSFAVLMALYPVQHPFGLLLATKIGLTISLLCLILCILTFKFCRSIKGTRTTIHLHLCICLFIADLIFLAGISKTTPVGGCKFVAAMLHLFFLGVFTWMLLEGVQLYRMVVQVFNTTIRPLYLYVIGYGIPLVIVIISAIVRPQRYGTDQYCWLSLKDGVIWSFFGPVCFIIFINAFFFVITVWKLAQKFTSLNPDLSNLHKIKAFTVTAIAQMCVLGLMWVFGAFLFREGAIVEAYIFTILNSLQGVLIFLLHCLLSKQVRDEYANFLSCICTARMKRYSDFSNTNPSSSQSHGSRSAQQTREAQI